MAVQERNAKIRYMEFYGETCATYDDSVDVKLTFDGDNVRVDDYEWNYRKSFGGIFIREGDEHGFMVLEYLNEEEKQPELSVGIKHLQTFLKNRGGFTWRQIEQIAVNMDALDDVDGVETKEGKNNTMEFIKDCYDKNTVFTEYINKGEMKKKNYDKIIKALEDLQK